MELFAIYDTKADAWHNRPFWAENSVDATRGLAAAPPEHEYAKYGEDFHLFAIGKWELADGLLVAYASKRSLGTVRELVAAINKDRE